jgi:23S rRNA pseudouridine1911/1915/1917 synthase
MGKAAPQRWKIETVLEDDALIAVVKPAGLPTANAPREKESLYTLLADRLGPSAFVGIVSRLDAPVSGLVVVAKTPAAAASLAEQFRERTTQKRYLAVVTGRFPAPLEQWVEWHDRLSRAEGDRCSVIVPPAAIPPAPGAEQGRRQVKDRLPAAPGRARRSAAAAVQEARSRARVQRRGGEVSLVELEPQTGRRHQLRVQLASRGCPIVGDRQYGSRLPFPEPGGIALHAAELEIQHPADGRRLRIVAPLPDAWRDTFTSLLLPGARSS